MSISNGWFDNLSAYYVDAIDLNIGDVHILKRMLQLYNIQYLAMSTNFLENEALYNSHFKRLVSHKDIEFLEVANSELSPFKSSYFEIVHLPGFVDGNLRNARETVLETLHLYSTSTLLYLNPREENDVRCQGTLNIQVSYLHTEGGFLKNLLH